jgi:hypothetical protein
VTPSRAVAALAVLSILLLAATVRCISYHDALRDAGWHLRDGDSYYHLRRVEQTIQRGGRVPMFDPHLAFPEGQRIQWHGGYDLLVAGLVAASCGTTPDRSCLTTVAAVSTPCLGVLATLLVLWLGWALGGRWIGLGAGFLFATYPFSAGAAALGRVDHHVLEPLLVAVWFLLLLRKRPTSAGVVAGLSFAFFPSALLPVASTVMALSVRRLLVGQHRDKDWRFVVAATVVLIPVVLTGPFPDTVEPAGVSLFHLLSMAAASLAVVSSEVVVRFRRNLLAASVPYLLCGLMLLLLTRGHLSTLLRFGASTGLWSNLVHHAPIGGHIATTLLFGLLLAGAGVAVSISGVRNRRREIALVGMASLPLALAGTLQIRFLPVASALLAPVLASAVLACGRWLLHLTRGQRRRTQHLALAVVGALVVLTLVPLREYFVMTPGDDHGMGDGIKLLRRLGAHRTEHGAEAVLADWVWGHHILWFARRPTIASPFILSGRDSANVAVRRALLGEAANDLVRLMERRRARYVLVSPRLDLQRAPGSVGLKPRRSVFSALLAEDPPPRLRLVDRVGGTQLYKLTPIILE